MSGLLSSVMVPSFHGTRGLGSESPSRKPLVKSTCPYFGVQGSTSIKTAEPLLIEDQPSLISSLMRQFKKNLLRDPFIGSVSKKLEYLKLTREIKPLFKKFRVGESNIYGIWIPEGYIDKTKMLEKYFSRSLNLSSRFSRGKPPRVTIIHQELLENIGLKPEDLEIIPKVRLFQKKNASPSIIVAYIPPGYVGMEEKGENGSGKPIKNFPIPNDFSKKIMRLFDALVTNNYPNALPYMIFAEDAQSLGLENYRDLDQSTIDQFKFI